MGKSIVFHSYKGGTGKTTIAANVAALFAQKKQKVCIIDFDFRAPSLHFLYKTRPVLGRCMNDFLEGKCQLENALQTVNIGNERLSVGFADSSSKAMWESTRKDKDWWSKTFRKVLDAKKTILNDLGFDYLIIDTSPGIQDSSMNALAAADIIMLVLKHDELEFEGTRELVEGFHKKLGRRTAMILNRVLAKPYEQVTIEDESSLRREIEDLIGLPVIGVIPCYCDVLIGGNQILYAVEKPEHPFSQRLLQVANHIPRVGI